MTNRPLLSADERDAYRTLLVMAVVLKQEARHIQDRLSQAGRKGLFNAAASQIENALVQSLKGVDPDHLALLEAGTRGKSLRLAAASAAGADNGHALYEVRANDLMRLVCTALESQCAFCMHADNLHEMRTCPLRKTLDAMPVMLGNESLDRPCVFALAQAELARKAAQKPKPAPKRRKKR
jgi:hypothetical protein|nr:MAG TPA: hypothetical protein [Caudoviricetes sp.]